MKIWPQYLISICMAPGMSLLMFPERALHVCFPTRVPNACRYVGGFTFSGECIPKPIFELVLKIRPKTL